MRLLSGWHISLTLRFFGQILHLVLVIYAVQYSSTLSGRFLLRTTQLIEETYFPILSFTSLFLLFVAHVLYLLQNISPRISLVKGCSWSAHLIWNVDYVSVYNNWYISGHLLLFWTSHAVTDVAEYGWVIWNNLHRVKNLLITFKFQVCQTQQLAMCSVSMEWECCKGKESHSCSVTSSKRIPVTFQALRNLLNIFLNVWSFDKMCKSGGSSFIFVPKFIYFYFLTSWQCMDKLLKVFQQVWKQLFLCIRYCA